MVAVQLILFICLILASFSTQVHAGKRCCPVKSCQTFETIIKKKYFGYARTMRRNAPSALTHSFVAYRIHTLASWMRKNCDCGVKRLKDACFTRKEYGRYHRSLPDVPRIHQVIRGMRKADPNIFYITLNDNPNGKRYPDSLLFPFSKRQRKLLRKGWYATSRIGLLSAHATTEQIKRTIKVPSGVHMFYEPLSEEEKCRMFNKFIDSKEDLVDSRLFLAEVLAITSRMHLCGVKSEDYLQILRHATAYVYSGIRCRRAEREALRVSRVFLPWYKEIARQFIDPNCDVGNMNKRMFFNNYRFELNQLSSHDCWGQIQCFKFAQEKVQLVKIGKKFYQGRSMRRLRRKLRLAPKYIYKPRRTSVTKKHYHEPISKKTKRDSSGKKMSERSSEESLHISGGECGEDFYLGGEGPVCCGKVCQCTSLLSTVGIMTEQSCCTMCNDGGCGDNDLFRAGSTVELYSYGSTAMNYALRLPL